MAETLTVACKLPNGLLLRVFDQVEYDEPVLGGGMKRAVRAVQKGEAVRVHGPAVPFGQQSPVLIVGGFALTPNIDADFFKAWLEQNADHDAVKAGLIFAHSKDTQGAAAERKALQSGLQPLVPDVDPRIPRSPNRNLSKIETDKAA